MNEIAETFQAAGLPEEFHKAAAEIYRRMSGFKDSAETPSLENVLEILLTE
jgi:transcription initiation factor TFIIIB Brf1 subunit/transcription initiation factor TFIIB